MFHTEKKEKQQLIAFECVEVKGEVLAASENEKEYQSDACDIVFIDQRNLLPFTETQKDEDKSRKDYSEDFALKMEVKVDPLEFQIQHYAYEYENFHAKLMSETLKG